MDTHTLVVMNVLLYVLYAGVIVVNSRMIGTAKGAGWFAGANLSRGGGLLLIALGNVVPVTRALSGLLAVLGMMMLHFSFDELLERATLTAGVAVCAGGGDGGGNGSPAVCVAENPGMLLLTCATESVQVAATASVVFLFAGEELWLAASLTGASLVVYALLLLSRVAVILRFGAPELSGSGQRDDAVLADRDAGDEQRDRLWLHVSLGGEAARGAAVACTGR